MIFGIPPKEVFGKSTHAYWEDFLSEDEINYILSVPEWLNTANGSIGGSSGNGVINREVRETNISWLSLDKDNVQIWQKLSNAVAEVNSRFFNFDLTGFYEPAQLSAYFGEKESHYSWHVDSGVSDRTAPRKLSMALMLSNLQDFDGGELQIKATSDEPVTLEQKRGRAWFFPSYTLHRVTPVTRGTRRTLVLWVGGPAFK